MVCPLVHEKNISAIMLEQGRIRQGQGKMLKINKFPAFNPIKEVTIICHVRHPNATHSMSKNTNMKEKEKGRDKPELHT